MAARSKVWGNGGEGKGRGGGREALDLWLDPSFASEFAQMARRLNVCGNTGEMRKSREGGWRAEGGGRGGREEGEGSGFRVSVNTKGIGAAKVVFEVDVEASGLIDCRVIQRPGCASVRSKDMNDGADIPDVFPTLSWMSP
eukprot:192226-Chlamydomonas_euryale.AAC.1